MEKEPKIEVKVGGFTVYCVDENKILYQSEGKNRMIEELVARDIGIGHATQLNHTVKIFEGRYKC